jgi:hypothetical protein
MIEQVIERMFEGAGKQLPLQVNGNETGAGVDVFVTGHARLRNAFPLQTLNRYLVRGMMQGVFLQLR